MLHPVHQKPVLCQQSMKYNFAELIPSLIWTPPISSLVCHNPPCQIRLTGQTGLEKHIVLIHRLQDVTVHSQKCSLYTIVHSINDW